MQRQVVENERYLVTDSGDIINKRTGRKLKPQVGRHGYLRVYLWYGDKDKPHQIHRLVAAAYLDRPDGAKEVNHKNFDKADNRLENLEWCTRSENVQHAYDGGRYPRTRIRRN